MLTALIILYPYHTFYRQNNGLNIRTSRRFDCFKMILKILGRFFNGNVDGEPVRREITTQRVREAGRLCTGSHSGTESSARGRPSGARRRPVGSGGVGAGAAWERGRDGGVRGGGGVQGRTETGWRCGKSRAEGGAGAKMSVQETLFIALHHILPDHQQKRRSTPRSHPATRSPLNHAALYSCAR